MAGSELSYASARPLGTEAAHSPTETDLCSLFGCEREARLEAEAWSCVLCGETTLKGCV